ncbi:single-stranded-DNA-specific exonuclease RecJ [Cyanobacterium stanieri LEGE 03274]|uniref:Single-stranded-DNA-specific exonuclease RecJ n=1 Tax=Cyanobacterium stanieri LEGE 03274 TaxID=1828756 RepID=A0ABR9V5S2_9CHRO|nr:single-stranded-DNA-specific exonuclease RecJ [Cyanobacterium stanieri LEGE 03274]
MNQWKISPIYDIPKWFQDIIQEYTKDIPSKGELVSQILWHRGIREEKQLRTFLDSRNYQPTSAFDFGQEMKWAVNRLSQAWEKGEKVCIWGDFDADGITSTSVLWEGLGQFFVQDIQLSYYIPNRFKESHGLNCAGIDKLHQGGVGLIVTCDTGSTNLREIDYAKELGIDIIVTDHHTLPNDRPRVVSIINPRYFADFHPLYHLSGVAVAYKLMEALYETFPHIPTAPVEDLLDLVAIGLIADLVELKGDCRYLAQEGIKKLPKTKRCGIQKLLELCKANGDRPMDISFGIAPRINAVSRIHGDASFCVKLLTTKDSKEAETLAKQTEEANLNRKELQQTVLKQARKKVDDLDLSTTAVIVLEDNQWETGVLGLVASSISQEYGRPTILLSTMITNDSNLARGSARSVSGINLYDLVLSQQHLLSGFGGHPFAAGLALPLENLPLFRDGINQKLKQQLDITKLQPILEIDLTVTVAQLTKKLFRELKLLEPCGMGNSAPKLLIKNCWFSNVFHKSYTAKNNKNISYLVTYFNLCDITTQDKGIEGSWWGHGSNDIQENKTYDIIIEFDFNKHKRKNSDSEEGKYEPRIIDIKPVTNSELNYYTNKSSTARNNIVLKTSNKKKEHEPFDENYYQEIWTNFLGIIKYLINHQTPIDITLFKRKVSMGDRTLNQALKTIIYLGINYTIKQNQIQFVKQKIDLNQEQYITNLSKTIQMIKEEYLREYLSKSSV